MTELFKAFLPALVLLSFKSFSQAEKFDIATFSSPKGWHRADSNGVVLLEDMKTANGLTSFCQIYMYPSRQADTNTVKNFEEEWSSHVVKNGGPALNAAPQLTSTPDGWNIASGATNITRNQVTFTCILISATGQGRVMSFLVNVAGQEYMKDVELFLNSVVLKSEITNKNNQNSTALNTNSAGLQTDGNYVYVPPPGWSTTRNPDGIVLRSPAATNGEQCLLTLWPMRQSTPNLLQDANAVFGQVYKDYQLSTSSTPGSIIKGISAQGWEYCLIKHPVKLKGGDYTTLFAFVFVAKLGNELASISGMSKDPLVSSCFGLIQNDVWPKFFYSLQFKNWKSSNSAAALQKKIPGVWMSVTGTAGDRFSFASNGRNAGAAAAQKYYRMSSNELLTVTDAFFGDGAYALNGNTIVLTKDTDKNNSEHGFLRIEQESRDQGKTWKEKLYLRRKSVVDGSEYEVCYDKQ